MGMLAAVRVPDSFTVLSWFPLVFEVLRSKQAVLCSFASVTTLGCDMSAISSSCIIHESFRVIAYSWVFTSKQVRGLFPRNLNTRRTSRF